jgi:hypothetical protein
MFKPQIGMTLENLPEEYNDRFNKPADMALLMATEECPEGFIVLLKNSVVINVIEITNGLGPPGDCDAILINPRDVPAGWLRSIERAIEST